MNEIKTNTRAEVRSVSPGVSLSIDSSGRRQDLQRGGKKLPADSESESVSGDRKLEEALEKLRQQASRAGIELEFQLEEDVFGEVVSVIDTLEQLVLRRIPVAELIQQMDRQSRQAPGKELNGLLINGIA